MSDRPHLNHENIFVAIVSRTNVLTSRTFSPIYVAKFAMNKTVSDYRFNIYMFVLLKISLKAVLCNKTVLIML